MGIHKSIGLLHFGNHVADVVSIPYAPLQQRFVTPTCSQINVIHHQLEHIFLSLRIVSFLQHILPEGIITRPHLVAPLGIRLSFNKDRHLLYKSPDEVHVLKYHLIDVANTAAHPIAITRSRLACGKIVHTCHTCRRVDVQCKCFSRYYVKPELINASHTGVNWMSDELRHHRHECRVAKLRNRIFINSFVFIVTRQRIAC